MSKCLYFIVFILILACENHVHNEGYISFLDINKPKIEIISPKTLDSFNTNFEIVVRIKETLKLKSVEAIYLDTHFEPVSTNPYIFKIDIDSLDLGQITIKILATDEFGNKEREDISLNITN